MTDAKVLPRMWEGIRRFWNYPRLNSPRLLNQEEAEKAGMRDQIAGIRMDTSEILVNENNLNKKVNEENKQDVYSHEAGHFRYMPHNLKTCVRLVGHADKVTRNMKHAQIVENLYADLCVNTKAYRKGEHGILNVYQRLSENNNERMWQLYMSAYENLIGCQGMIVPEPTEEVKIKSKKLADIVNSSMDHADKWPESVKDFARIVKDYLKREDRQRKEAENNNNNNNNKSDQGAQSQDNQGNGDNDNGQDDNSGMPEDPGNDMGTSADIPQQNNNGNEMGMGAEDNQDKDSQGNQTHETYERKESQNYGGKEANKAPDITKGLVDYHKAKDFLPFDRDNTPEEVQDKQIAKELDGLAKELGEEQFKRVVAGLGLGTRKKANQWLYREMAKDYTLFLPQNCRISSGTFKETPVKWTMDDPLSELDLEYTLRQSPIIIPNATTYKWKTSEGESYGSSKSTPDLLIVLDSSGSMPDPGTDVSFPVLSAMIAADSALAYGNKVAVINFSSLYESCDFTNQSNIIDNMLMTYFGGGTEIPGDEMVKITSRHSYPIHTLIISDTEIANLSEELDNLERALKNSKSGGSIFLCCEPGEGTDVLEEIGYDLNFARDYNDLGTLTLDKSKELYSPV